MGGGSRRRNQGKEGGAQRAGSGRHREANVQPEELSSVRLLEEVEWAVRSLVTLRDVVARTFASASEIRCL